MKHIKSFFKSLLNAAYFLRTSSQLEYYVRTKNPTTHAEVEEIVREFYSMRSM